MNPFLALLRHHAPRVRAFLLMFAGAGLVATAPSSAATLPIQQVAAGGDTTCAIILGGAYCWGYNANGQAGQGNALPVLSPSAVQGLASGVTSVATSGGHSCAVAHGAAWCWGNNDYGQLGNNSLADSTVPVPVSGLSSGVTGIAVGDLHTCAIVNLGVRCWGSGALGQHGNGAAAFNSKVPVGVTGLAAGAGVRSLSAGRNHSCANVEGFAYCWGAGDSGEMGNSATTFINASPVPVFGFGGVSSNVTGAIDGGGSFTCGIKDAGAWCWGFGSNGQLGNGFNNNSAIPVPVATLGSGVTSISAGGGLHACAVASGGAHCWGLNNVGQLGNAGVLGASNVPVPVQGLGSGVEQVSAGGLHSCAITTAGLHCWGDNGDGQLGNGGQVASDTPILVIPAALAVGLLASPATLDFGGQSVRTTSPAKGVAVKNTGGVTVTFTGSAVTEGFDAATNCATLAPGATCTLSVAFTPVRAGAGTGYAVLDSSAGLVVVALAGAGELSLVTHYYLSILRRVPDAGGKAFWESEAARVAALGADMNETWFSMAQSFFASPEYAAFNRDNAGFVTDLYTTFFNRAPDAGGLAFWVGQLQAALPREVALASFMFSTEFAGFTQAIFGNTAARPETNTVMDFYRGMLSRLPDDGGFAFWRQKFRAAQCIGPQAVVAQVESISSGFALSLEYAYRSRSTPQYVGDLYNAFLRRGGDLAGVQHWIAQVTSGAMTREQLRRTFIASAEFQGRVQAIIAAGCLP